jgi:osmotically-inducible protein OsmY
MREPPQYVVEMVKDALTADTQVAALDLRARVVDDDVYLQGQVATVERCARAEQIVAALLPGYRVHNEIRVLDHVDAGDEERLA